MTTMLTAEQVSALASVPLKTIRHWATHYATTPTGPRPYRLAPRITRYRLDDVATWLGVEANQLRISA